MTVSATPRKAGPFDGNGVTTSFPFDFKVFSKTDLQVVRTNTIGIDEDLVLDSSYSVVLNADQDATPGGTVTYVGPPVLPDGWKLTIIGATPYDQVTDITNVGRFQPNVLEQTLDRATIQIQQLAEESARSVKVAASSTTDPRVLLQQILADAEAIRQIAATFADEAQAQLDALEAKGLIIINGMGYLVPVPYAAGLQMTSGRQTVSYGGQTYAPIEDEVPFTTSGVFEVAKFRLIQGISSADLGADNGGVLLGYQPEYGAKINADKMFDRIGPMTSLLGTVRQITSGAGWQWISDTGHRLRNFLAPSVDVNGNLVLPFTFNSSRVGALTVTPDEAYASLGLKLGASVATDKATVSGYKTLDTAVNLGTLSVVPSTYFLGKVSVAVDGSDPGVIVVTHPACGSASVIPTLTPVDTGQGFVNRIVGYASPTQVRIASFTQFWGYISYDGANWVVQTSAKNKPTMSFSAGVLTVTHESLGGSESLVAVKERDNVTLVARVGSTGTTTFEAVFRPIGGGAPIAAPTTDMRIQYMSAALVRRETAAGVVALARPNCALDMNQVATGSGNFWVQGQMWEAA